MYETRLRVENKLAEKMKEQAIHERRSINNLINIAIESYLDKGIGIEKVLLNALELYNREVETLGDKKDIGNLKELVVKCVMDGLRNDCDKRNTVNR